jgi:hypothetical protein
MITQSPLAGVDREPFARRLLVGAIDYAGLFPPAGLPMTEAAGNYAEYRAGKDQWALGRFIVPANRLPELSECGSDIFPPPGARSPWRVGALVGRDSAPDLISIDAFHTRHAGAATVDSLELKAATPALVEEALRHTSRDVDLYVEIPIDEDPAPLVDAVARVGARAKVRTGGVTAEMFPSPEQLARFIVACSERRVPFKATAGLHHAVCGSYPLTYEPGSDDSRMFGFLNVLVAGALSIRLPDQALIAELLSESDPRAFHASEGGIAWRDHILDSSLLDYSRAQGAVGFGSCSFEEPLAELRAAGLLA